jgi:hypothetical protein
MGPRPRTFDRRSIAWIAGAALAMASAGVLAQDIEADATPAGASDEVALRSEVASALRARRIDALQAPGFTRFEAAVPVLPVGAMPSAALADAAAPAGGRTQLEGVSRRWWISGERADVGVGVGTIGYSVVGPPGSATTSEEPRALRNAVPNLSVGMRYRVSDDSAIYADASNARGLYGKGSDAYFTKVGVEWQGAARKGWSIARGGIGLQLDSGKTMTMRVKGGGLGVYYRSKF